ncbi:MAG: transferrin-binding protein-like solute binding protein [Moraxella sp.]|nr:transferrin-binding protein-like solute binding protein [Moraxella sp.]
MKLYTKKPLGIIISALLLTACASGKGGFDLDNVSSLNTQGASQNAGSTNTPKEPTYQDEKGDRRTIDGSDQEPALGYMVEVPRRIFPMRDATAEDLTVDISPDKVKPINYSLDKLPKVFSDELEKQPRYIEDNGISYSHDRRSKATTRDLQFVRSGYVIAERGMEFVRVDGVRKQNPAGQYGYVFYQGINPATTLPTATATYTGTWDFVTNAVSTRKGLPEGFSNDLMDYGIKGNTVGATSLDADINRGLNNDKPVGLSSIFEVNFADKTLTGTLTQNHNTTNQNANQIITDRYSIEAKLNGNRFSGTAKAKDSSHAMFGKDGSLEGGFFGKNAEELAGKFLAEDSSLFGVFGAKRGTLDESGLQAKFDATVIDSSTLQKSDMDTFGQVSHLVINGKRLALLPDNIKSFADMDFIHTRQVQHDGKKLSVTVCCNNLDYVKFGSYGEVNEADGVTTIANGKLFLVGERTDIAKIPQLGTAHYRGTWEGFLQSADGRRWAVSASGEPSGARSRFDVDFGTKVFSGKLIGDNGTEELPILTLNGVVVGNGFSGTAKTREGGFNIDPNSTGAAAIVNINAPFSGGFYGADASELGGVIHDDTSNDKIAAVFGGKRQTQTP